MYDQTDDEQWQRYRYADEQQAKKYLAGKSFASGICVGGPCHGQVRVEPKLFFEVKVPVFGALDPQAYSAGDTSPMTIKTTTRSYRWLKWWGELGSHLPVWVLEGSTESDELLEQSEALVGFLMNYRMAPPVEVDVEVETGAQVLARLGLAS